MPFTSDVFEGPVSAIIFTMRLHVMQRTVLLSELCPSIRQMRVL